MQDSILLMFRHLVCLNIKTNCILVRILESIDTKIGSTDISSIGDGSITGAISAQNSALTNKANASTVTILSDKAYQTDDSEESAIDDADYIPFYDSSASAKKKIKVENLNPVTPIFLCLFLFILPFPFSSLYIYRGSACHLWHRNRNSHTLRYGECC